jgi:cytosine/adenosine deaminase-related metal-dependent hydrolase
MGQSTLHLGHDYGIEVGKPANLIVLDTGLMRSPPFNIELQSAP